RIFYHRFHSVLPLPFRRREGRGEGSVSSLLVVVARYTHMTLRSVSLLAF
ncbi:MAG: hypothetical protein QOJ40_2893, partial [Verrucomicrobiota bacterium]